ncbi:hypothetical protein BOTBODRAFT_33997 [Botryobasidium botryosum FD-172 SS1]|uniref:Phosphoglycerate mutase-like protein n=1 Tax=Botryobasidium botryosum (strain FD-172 SS1) TaxID=930990 RepID=A0A067MBD5_BOTB1|nr:hypothetical protein BOTBODRAFT_33997 [Botryobasidium botryosum FD-172 SS1]
MIKTIYVARHGFRQNWVSTEWKTPTGLDRDPPLAAHGVDQAKELAQHILSFPASKRPTAIFSSPFYRCLQTAAPIAEALQLPIFVEHGIGEWYSPVEEGTGIHPRPGDAASLRAFFSQIDPSWTPTWLPSQLGEFVDGLHDRVAGFLEAFVPRVESQLGHHHENILLVSHAATAITLVRELEGDRTKAYRIGCCALSTVERKSDKQDQVVGNWTAKAVGDASFLTNGVERDWGMEDILIEDGKVVHDHGVPGTKGQEPGPEGLQYKHTPSSRM